VNTVLIPELLAQPRRLPKRRRGDSTIRKHTVSMCETTGLLRFRSAEQARDALNSTKWARIHDLRTTGRSRRRETRYWRCPDCNGGYHLAAGASRSGDAEDAA
jgi:hypothetical protein